MEPSDADEAAYSRAFEKLVESEDDYVGLLAYATYKQSVRQSFQEGRDVDRTARSLPPAMVEVFRSSAEQSILKIVERAIVQATPDIQNSAAIANLDVVKSEVIAALSTESQAITKHVDERTGFWSTLGINFLAWLITLFIAVAFILLAGRPSLERGVAASVAGNEAKVQSKEEAR